MASALSRVGLAAGVVACVLVVAGCTGDSSSSSSSSPSGVGSQAPSDPGSSPPTVVPEDRNANFANMARDYLDGPDATTLSEAQVALITRAIETGGISFEEYQEALQNTFDCFDKAGIGYSSPPPSNDRGFPFIAYSYEATESGENPVATRCIKENSDAIESLYQLQPSSLEQQDAMFEAAMPALVSCMREGGYFADLPDPTVEEAKEELLAAMSDYAEKGPVPDGAWSPRGCADSAGISSF